MKLAVLTFFSSLVVLARGGDFSRETPEILSLGKKVFEANCTSCHGAKGDGQGPAARAIVSGPKPRDFTTGIFKYGSESKAVFETITKGSPGTAMPAWNQLSEKERWAVAHFVKAFKKK